MRIEIVNHSTVCSQPDVADWTTAIAEQLTSDVAPQWERVAPVVELAPGSNPSDPNAYAIRIFDDADQAGALGYHDVGPDGKPYGKVFAKTTIDNGGNVSTTLSHEAIELFLDPDCTLWAIGTDNRLHAVEGCDAVEADEYDKEAGDTKVKVSNFLLAPYFSANPPAGSRFDFLGKLSKPSPAKSAGGYSIDADISNENQSFARSVAFHEAVPQWKRDIKAHAASRTSRRLTSAKA